MSAVPEWCSYWYQVRTFVKKVLASSMDSKHSRSRGGRGARLSHQTGREPLESSGSGLAAAMCWLISVDELASPYNCPFAHGLCSGAITAGRPLHHYQATVRLSASHPVLSPSAFSLNLPHYPNTSLLLPGVLVHRRGNFTVTRVFWHQSVQRLVVGLGLE